MSQSNKPQQNEFMRAFAVLLQIGINIIVCVAIGVFLGWLLDRLLGTSPWMMIVFILFGIGAAIKSIFEFSKKIK